MIDLGHDLGLGPGRSSILVAGEPEALGHGIKSYVAYVTEIDLACNHLRIKYIHVLACDDVRHRNGLLEI
jgi:hypothetical protein